MLYMPLSNESKIWRLTGVQSPLGPGPTFLFSMVYPLMGAPPSETGLDQEMAAESLVTLSSCGLPGASQGTVGRKKTEWNSHLLKYNRPHYKEIMYTEKNI